MLGFVDIRQLLLRCRHSLGGRGQKFAKFDDGQWYKSADGRGVGVKNHEKFADVLNGWSLRPTCLTLMESSSSCSFKNWLPTITIIISKCVFENYNRISSINSRACSSFQKCKKSRLELEIFQESLSSRSQTKVVTKSPYDHPKLPLS